MFADEDIPEKWLENGLQKKIPIERASVNDKMYFLKYLFIYILVQYFLNCVMTGYLMFTPLLRFHFNENNMYLMSVFIIFALTYSLLIFLSLKLHHHVKWWHHIALFLHMISQAITVSILVAVYEWLSVLSTYLFLSVAFSILFLFTLQRRMEYKYWAVMYVLKNHFHSYIFD
ncbi:uncharacterized protein LOC129227919 [Uloborus diversus]|uniref:uncharacterized protein LOC129227919 n=1 Tax=Uloborus diversus TaxID=327109 RepID=UPI002409B939|nr:uncharacterized protein LOC129227919 [Uloborus diversus]